MSEVGMKKLSTNVTSSYVFVTSYTILILGLLLLNALQSLEVIPSYLAQYIRASLHIIPFITIFYFFSIYKLLITRRDLSIVRIGIASLMVAFMLLSVLNNGTELSAVERMLITLLHLFNLTILLPLSMRFIDINLSVKLLIKFYCCFLFSICILVLFNYIYGEFVWTRVGYPYIPGVYAYMCLVAFVVSVGVLRADIIGGFFLMNVFLSGSRAALALAVAIYLLNCLIGGLGLKRVAVMVMSSCIFFVSFIYMVEISRPDVEISRPDVEISRPDVDISRPYTVERKDLTSGRMDLWREAVNVLHESPFLGYSKKMVFGEEKNGRGLVAHNSFLDLSVQYGLIYAALAYLYWFSFASVFVKQKLHVTNVAWSLFFVVTAKSLITNIFWTNMGDGVTYFIFVLLILTAIGTKGELHRHE